MVLKRSSGRLHVVHPGVTYHNGLVGRLDHSSQAAVARANRMELMNRMELVPHTVAENSLAVSSSEKADSGSLLRMKGLEIGIAAARSPGLGLGHKDKTS